MLRVVSMIFEKMRTMALLCKLVGLNRKKWTTLWLKFYSDQYYSYMQHSEWLVYFLNHHQIIIKGKEHIERAKRKRTNGKEGMAL